MKRVLTLTVIALFALIIASCGGPNKAFNKEYNVKDGNPKTKACIEMVKKNLSKERPGAKIVKYTDVYDINTESGHYHAMVVQTKENGSVENVHWYFPEDYSFTTKKIEYLLQPDLWQ